MPCRIHNALHNGYEITILLYRLLLSEAGLAGILTVLHACIDIKGTILDRFHYLLFFLSASMNPRYLNTVDVDLNPLSVTVRVGQAVETVGQAGRPKTITGFQVLFRVNLPLINMYVVCICESTIQNFSVQF